MREKLLSLFILTFISTALGAQEVRYLKRSPEALLMGDAYTSLADDSHTLFYNPAALANSSAAEITLFNPTLGVTNALDESERFENFPDSDPVAINERLQGLPVYAQAGIAPSIKMGGFFGLNFLANSTTSLMLRNRTNPEIDIDHRYDRGFVMGAAYTFGRAPSVRGRGRSRSGSYTSLGFGFKYLKREGVKNTYDLFGTKLLSDIANGVADADDIKEAFGHSEGKSYGFDLGVLHSMTQGRSSFNFGLSILDIGDTRFELESGNAPLPDQEMLINLGTSMSYDLSFMKATFAMDIHPVNKFMDFGRKLHFGTRIELPFVDLMGGWNGGYLSYGASVQFWPVRLMAGFYDVEIGADFKQERAKRAVIYLSLLETSFDL